MRFPKLSSLFSSTNYSLTQNLIATSPSSSPSNPFPNPFSFFSRRFFFRSPGKTVGGSLTKEEESVYSWLYSIAQSEKFLAFEYVQSTERGLSFKEADRRLKEIGPNVPLEDIHPRWWCLLWKAFFHPFNIILIVLSTLSYLASDSPNGFIMLVLVFTSVSLRFSQEFSSSKAAMQLAELVKRPVRIQRCAGRVVQVELRAQIDQRDVVPGDIVVFQPGDLFPGDVRLLSSKHLVVSQSSLTGESGTVDKTADIRETQSTPLLDLKNICFMGTNVVSGSGTGLVVSTGSKTYISTMFSSIGERKPADDFERGVRDITYGLILLMLVLVTIIVLADYLTSHDIGECILFGISVASALTPQMLPLVVNTSLSRGALAMAKHRCIVKSANAIRDMGSMDILCIDKTGTLTTDHGIVVDHLDAWGAPREEVLRFAFLNSYFTSEQKHPLDNAILAHVYTSSYRFEPSKWRKLDEIPFDFVRRRVSVVLNTCSDSGRLNPGHTHALVITKGALEDVIKACSFVERAETGVSLLTLEHRRRILGISEGLSNDGLRVIGVAIRRHLLLRSGDGPHELTGAESSMSFLGLLTFVDPPKDSAKQALRRLAEKGVAAKVMTGDSLPLAVRVCREVGMRTEHVITGPELDLLPPQSFDEAVGRATVLARLTPAQKLRAVRSLQAGGGHVVGFLGDGVNDSLALEAANVGVSVESGASVAKDRADIILLENDLSVVAAGVERGRAAFANTVGCIGMSITANVGAAVSLLAATVCLRFEPLTPRQLLVRTVLCSSGQLAIPWDRAEEGGGGPRRWSTGGMVGFIAWNAPVCSACDVGALAFLWFCYGGARREARFVRTALFTEGVVMQVLVVHVVRTKRVAFLQGFASWQVMCSTAAVSGLGLSLPYTPVGAAMDLVPLPLSYLGFLLALVFVYLYLAHLVKTLYILLYKNWL